MNILFVGDVFGDVGRRVLAEKLEGLKDSLKIDAVIANGENCAGGRGITPRYARKFRKYGVDIITGGNHSPEQPAVYSDTKYSSFVIRPYNCSDMTAGNGIACKETEKGAFAVINILGRVFLRGKRECPFKSVDRALENIPPDIKTVIVDFHAEATSEKVCMGHYLDGRVSAMVGTHTHVQTNDGRILPGKTAYITDVGMTGPEISAIGMTYEPVMAKLLSGTSQQFVQARDGAMFNGVLLEIDEVTGTARTITPVLKRYY
ncbi:MAG: TIGR00282 family metallophosphoesterase [Fibrobacterota bacterium]